MLSEHEIPAPPPFDEARLDAIMQRADVLRRRQRAVWAASLGAGVVLLAGGVLMAASADRVSTETNLASPTGSAAASTPPTTYLNGDEYTVFDLAPSFGTSTVAVDCVDGNRAIEVTFPNLGAEPLQIDSAYVKTEGADDPLLSELTIEGSPAPQGNTIRLSGTVDGSIVGAFMVVTDARFPAEWLEQAGADHLNKSVGNFKATDSC